MLLTEAERNQLEQRRESYKALIEKEDMPALDSAMTGVMYKIFENTEKELNEATVTGDIAQFTPVLMNLIRRTMPSLVGNQMVGVQAMSAPTGRIFAQHVYYGSSKATGTETWANGPVGTATAAGAAPNPAHTGPYSTADGEALGWGDSAGQVNVPADAFGAGTPAAETSIPVSGSTGMWPEMSFSIDYVDVSVETRALKGKLTTEIVSDLKAVHGLDAESELVNILQAEITGEIDREIVGRIIREAKVGAINTSTPGTFAMATDADGRWIMEKITGLLVQIEREATWIAQETRRGRGNFVLTSPEVASYLSMANLITHEYGNTGFNQPVNPVGISYYGKLCGRYKVYVDPYLVANGSGNTAKHMLLVGYKGANAYDSGVFYCPYIPLQFFKAQGQEDFGLRLGVKSRYGLVSNPYYVASGTTSAAPGTNSYYRKFDIVF